MKMLAADVAWEAYLWDSDEDGVEVERREEGIDKSNGNKVTPVSQMIAACIRNLSKKKKKRACWPVWLCSLHAGPPEK